MKLIPILFRENHKLHHLSAIFLRHASNYIQGQAPEKDVREYFYYVDHQGMVSLKPKNLNIQTKFAF